MRIKWQDIDAERNLIYIHAEKSSNDRYQPISQKLLGMLNQMPKINDKVFQPSKHGFTWTFTTLRKRTAKKLQNPRLMQIHLHTFRHWYATTKMHEYKDAWAVKELLGHKSVVSTEVYIHIEKQIYTQLNAGFITKIALTVEECCNYAEQGFEKFDEIDGKHLYRKRK
jgi:integrase/recombinase XerD